MIKIAFCGGGSAGHVIPNIAIIEELPKDFAAYYLGTNAIEKSICQKQDVPFYEFSGVKLVRGKVLCNLAIPFKLLKSVAQCKKILKEVNPSLLFCKGGYASLPPALAANSLKIPIILHESDITMGLANRIIAKKAELVLSSFPQTVEKIQNGVCVGSPIRKNIFNKDSALARKKLGLDYRPTILVFGGGSGSKIINDCLRKVILKLCKKYNVLHVCGKGNKINSKIYGYYQFEFFDNMGELYACSDYAVARCGSNSAFELISQKIPTLFIPLDNGASRGDQVQNAKYFQSKGLCKILLEKELTPQMLFTSIEHLICDEDIKTALCNNNTQYGTDNAIKEICNFIKN